MVLVHYDLRASIMAGAERAESDVRALERRKPADVGALERRKAADVGALERRKPTARKTPAKREGSRWLAKRLLRPAKTRCEGCYWLSSKQRIK